MYLLTGVADLVLRDNEINRAAYCKTLFRLWNNVVEQNMYLTAGMYVHLQRPLRELRLTCDSGAVKQWEGFGIVFLQRCDWWHVSAGN